MHDPRARAAGGHDRVTEEYHSSDACATRAFKEGQHDRLRVGVATRRDEIHALDAGERAGMGSGVVPVKAGRERSAQPVPGAVGRGHGDPSRHQEAGQPAASGSTRTGDENASDWLA